MLARAASAHPHDRKVVEYACRTMASLLAATRPASPAPAATVGGAEGAQRANATIAIGLARTALRMSGRGVNRGALLPAGLTLLRQLAAAPPRASQRQSA